MASNITFNTGLRSLLATQFAVAFNAANGSTLKMYDGSSNLLVTINLPATAFTISNGVATKAGTWSAVVAQSGTATSFIMGYTTAWTITGYVGTAGCDINLDNNILVAGGTVTISTFTITQPA